MAQKNKHGRTKSAVGLLSIFLLCVTVYAQNAERIRGKVTDENGAIISGATIVLRNEETGFERIASTDKNGEFSFSEIGNGKFTVTASAEGFTRLQSALTDTQNELNLQLKPANIREEVTVYSGSRQDELRESLNTKVDVLTEKDIRDTGYETVGEVLREVPGVLTRRGSETTGAAGEQVQGLDSRQVLVLFDGFPVIGARGIKRGVLNLDRQSTANLQQIEVVKGASSALFGSDAIGGVINLIPKEPSRRFEGNVTISGGNFGVFSPRVNFGISRGKFGTFFSLERHKNNGFDLTPTTFDTTGAGFHRYDLYNRSTYKFNDKFKITTLFDGYRNKSKGRSLGEEGFQTNNIDEDVQSYGLTADVSPTGRTNIQLRGYFSRFGEITRGVLQNGTPLPDGNLFERLGQLDATLSYVWGERQLIQIGGEWRTTRYRGINRLRDSGGNRADTRNLWAQDKISLSNRLTLTIGARYDNHSIFGSAFSPKIGLNFRLGNNANLRASWGRGYRAPDLGQLFFRFLNPTNFYQVIGNPNLSPEHSGSWQVGGEYRAFNRKLRLGVNVFRNDVVNLIEAVSLGFVATQGQLNAIIAREGIDPAFRPVIGRLLFFYKNIQNIYTQGAELDGELVLPKGFGINFGYTYLDAYDKRTKRYLLSRNRHQAFARLSYTNPKIGLTANLRGSLYGSWLVSRTTAGAETKAPSFELYDIYASQRVFKRFEIFGAIDNFLDSKDRNTGKLLNGQPLPIYRPEAGRLFRVGLRWNFGGEK